MKDDHSREDGTDNGKARNETFCTNTAPENYDQQPLEDLVGFQLAMLGAIAHHKEINAAGDQCADERENDGNEEVAEKTMFREEVKKQLSQEKSEHKREDSAESAAEKAKKKLFCGELRFSFRGGGSD